jgi:hypothetical protein
MWVPKASRISFFVDRSPSLSMLLMEELLMEEPTLADTQKSRCRRPCLCGGRQEALCSRFSRKTTLVALCSAALKLNGTSATCPAKDITCYFLPMGKCAGDSSQIMKYKTTTKYSDYKDYVRREAVLVTKYITRQQQWLRKAVYHYNQAKAPVLKDGENCTVMHVRRGDVVLHSKNSRRYFPPISDHVDKLPSERKVNGSTILLLRDDANAIDEANTFFPFIENAFGGHLVVGRIQHPLSHQRQKSLLSFPHSNWFSIVMPWCMEAVVLDQPSRDRCRQLVKSLQSIKLMQSKTSVTKISLTCISN